MNERRGGAGFAGTEPPGSGSVLPRKAGGVNGHMYAPIVNNYRSISCVNAHAVRG